MSWKATLQVDPGAGRPVAQVGLSRGFGNGCHAVEAGAGLPRWSGRPIVAQTLVGRSSPPGPTDPERAVAALTLHLGDTANLFDYSGKHARKLGRIGREEVEDFVSFWRDTFRVWNFTPIFAASKIPRRYQHADHRFQGLRKHRQSP